jgi:hypothetical protein
MARPPPPTVNEKQALAVHVKSLQRARTPQQLVELARRYTLPALKEIAGLAGVEPQWTLPKLRVLDKFGNLVEVDQEVPPAVRLKALEILLDRGYGKAPQSIAVTADASASDLVKLTIEERIAAIKRDRENRGNTTDLEASEIVEVEPEPEKPQVNVTPPPAPPETKAEDFL